MNHFSAIGSAIVARLGTVQYTYHTDGTATTTGTLGLYDTVAWQGSAQPYVIFQYMAGSDEYTFGTVSGESADYMVKAVSNRQTPYQAMEIYERAHQHMQDAPLSLTGGYALRVRRTGRISPFQDAQKIWHCGGLYRIDTWST